MSVILRAEDCPPDDQPWLLSSRGDLRRDQARLESWLKDRRASYPGAHSAFEEKLAWISKTFTNMGWGRWEPASPVDALREILYESCPESVTVQLVLARSDVDKMCFTSAEEEASFLSAPEVVRAGWDGKGDLPSFQAWLRKDATPGTEIEKGVGPGAKRDYVVLAQFDGVSRDASCVDTLVELCRRVHLLRAELASEPVPYDTPPERIGELMHFPAAPALPKTAMPKPSGAKGGKKAATSAPPAASATVQQCVAVVVAGFHPVKSATPDGWRKGLDAHARESGLTYVLVPNAKKDDDDEDDGGEKENGAQRPASASTHVPLWLPKEYHDIRKRVLAHCWNGEGECEHIRARLEKGNTDSTNVQLAIFTAEFQALKEMRTGLSAVQKLMTVLALLEAMCLRTTWCHDIEYDAVDEAEKLVSSIGEYLRLNLLRKTDAELGLDSHGGTPREALHGMLALRKKQLEEEEGNVSIKFSYIARKRRTNAEMAAARSAGAVPASKKAHTEVA